MALRYVLCLELLRDKASGVDVPPFYLLQPRQLPCTAFPFVIKLLQPLARRLRAGPVPLYTHLFRRY